MLLRGIGGEKGEEEEADGTREAENALLQALPERGAPSGRPPPRTQHTYGQQARHLILPRASFLLAHLLHCYSLMNYIR